MPPATRARNRVMSPEALDVLLGAPKPQTKAERLVAAVRKKKAEVEASVYQRDFHKFLTELVWTRDEARAGVVRKFPDYPYLKDICDALIERDLLLMEKSRRVLASWVVCAFDIWVCAGGQDPRWVNSDGENVLMLSQRNRKVLVAALKQEGEQSSEWFLHERIKAILEESEAHGLREAWPSFPQWTAVSDKILFRETNSYIAAVPEGPDKLRGAGTTFIHAEEVAFWPHAKASITAALPVLQGGGHICGVTTAQVNSFAAEIVKKKSEGQAIWRDGQILPLTLTTDGWYVLRIHYSAVPHYNIDEARRGFTTEQDRRRELEIDWSASSGVQVYPQFDRDRHVAAKPIPFDPRQPLYCGWDFGGCPAFVVTQLNSHGQWLILSAVAPAEGQSISTYEFGQMVADHLQHEYVLPAGLEGLEDLRLLHFGDPAGGQRAIHGATTRASQARSHFEIIRDGVDVHLGRDERGEEVVDSLPGWGWYIAPGAVDLPTRMNAVVARLKLSLNNGAPAIVVDPRCEVIVDGFNGGYHYPVRADGRVEYDPAKTYHSHAMNALEYVGTRLFRQAPKETDEDAPRHEVRSRAAGRDRGRW
jgi:hypothetical protein